MRLAATLTPMLVPFVLAAQQPVTRADAVAAALARGARVALGRADTTAALGAPARRGLPQSHRVGTYSKDTPNYHALGDLPPRPPVAASPQSGPRNRRVTPRAIASPSSGPRSGSTSTRPTAGVSLLRCSRVCRAAPPSMPTACCGSPSCGGRGRRSELDVRLATGKMRSAGEPPPPAD